VECGAYIHELHRLYIGLQSDKLKNVHIADVVKPTILTLLQGSVVQEMMPWA